MRSFTVVGRSLDFALFLYQTKNIWSPALLLPSCILSTYAYPPIPQCVKKKSPVPPEVGWTLTVFQSKRPALEVKCKRKPGVVPSIMDQDTEESLTSTRNILQIVYIVYACAPGCSQKTPSNKQPRHPPPFFRG